MTSMMQRKRFFSYESTGNSSNDLPILSRASPPASPPSSGNFAQANNHYAMDFSRIVPGKAKSMSIVRQRSNLSLSPEKCRPRKSISMFFPTSTSTNSFSEYDSPDYHSHNHNYNHNTYGMLNPGPLVRTNSNKHHNSHWICSLVSVMLVVTLATLGVSTYQHNTQLHHELLFKDQEIEMHLEHAHALERRVNGMRSETIHLHNRIEELENPEPTQEELNIQRKVFHLEHHQEVLHRGIQEQAKRLVVEKYGPGPKYYVELKLAFDPNSQIVQDATTEIGDTIWLETARLDEMPHTIHFFLEQVSKGVYDNTAIFKNAPRLIQAGPGYDARQQIKLEHEEPSLAHFIFQEHSSPQLNHQQYTLGYPGGPDWYVNMQDNSQTPSQGSSSEDILAKADPCFARIIRGFSTMERIARSNVLEDEVSFRHKQYRMVEPVTIVSMRVHDMTAQQSYLDTVPASSNFTNNTSLSLSRRFVL